MESQVKGSRIFDSSETVITEDNWPPLTTPESDRILLYVSPGRLVPKPNNIFSGIMDWKKKQITNASFSGVLFDNKSGKPTATRSAGLITKVNGEQQVAEEQADDGYWVCCNPGNYDPHERVGWPIKTKRCRECGHGTCLACAIGGVRVGSVSANVLHSINPL